MNTQWDNDESFMQLEGILVLGEKSNKLQEGIFKEQLERTQLKFILARLKR